MNHEPHVWFVDAHSKGDGCHYDLDLIGHPELLNLLFAIRLEISVVVSSRNLFLVEHLRNLLAVLLGKAVYDSAFA